MDEKEMDGKSGEPQKTGRGGGRVLTGFFLVVIGAVLLLDQMGFYFPNWLMSWQFLMIVIGIFLGFKHGFRGGAWLVLILIGGAFLFEDNFPGIPIHRFWPLIMIVIGLMIIIRPRGKDHWHRRWEGRWEEYAKNKNDHCGSGRETYISEDYIDSTTIFGGVHKRIVSKNFKGGDVTSIMGGTEINLSQADFTGVVVLDVTQVMGGTKLIVPPHWEIRSEISAIFAGFEDKRQQSTVTNPDKILILRGTSIFGGIEIKNYA
jgi:predicted membrane protein